MRPVLQAGLLLPLALAASAGFAAGPKLYDTGPGEDVAYVRFVNATGKPIDIVAAGKKGGQLHVDAAHPASAFQSVPPKKPMPGRITQGSASVEVSPTAAPGELVTVVVWNQGGKLSTTVLSEQPKDFNALKSTVAFYNFNPQCPEAGLSAAGRDAVIVDNTAPLSVKRRAVNPVALNVQPTCGTQHAGGALDMKTLEAGQRYSVFLAPQAGGPGAFWVKDEL